MGRKPKFRPRISWVKLNPEQAVLACSCYANGLVVVYVGSGGYSMVSPGGACYGTRNTAATYSLYPGNYGDATSSAIS